MEVDDDTSFDWFMFIRQPSSTGPNPVYWISNDAGLGTEYEMVTSSGDHLVWSS